jgi:site-specific DNA-methyltransferase (adenine-specific)
MLGADRWRWHDGEALAYLRGLPDACVDAVITDPPYSSGGFTRGDRMASTTSKYVDRIDANARPEFSGDNRDQRAFAYWCALWLAEALRVAKPQAPICMFTDWRQLPSTSDSLQAGGWVWRGIVPWDKTEGARPRMGGFRNQCEYVVWGSAGPLAEREDVGCLGGLIRQAVEKVADKHHIAGKPTQVMQALARICPPGGIILDLFAGSGTTGVGALLEGRRFLGVEVVPAYGVVARARLAAVANDVGLEELRAGQAPLFPEP